jgi:hypothetical protein
MRICGKLENDAGELAKI